ncbi:MAG: carbonic anhydrase family protein [Flavobacteriales bacterium]
MTSEEEQKATTPEKALERLKTGHDRFLKAERQERDLKEEVASTSKGQNPYAFVLGCIDSRVPIETLFDEGIGDLFTARVAGNVVNEDLLGSMEFACAMAGTSLIVVLGHSSCGAVKGACNEVELGNLTPLLKKIVPAIDSVAAETDPNDTDFPDLVSRENVARSIERIRQESPTIKDLEEKGSVGIAGAFYDVGSGELEWL